MRFVRDHAEDQFAAAINAQVFGPGWLCDSLSQHAARHDLTQCDQGPRVKPPNF